MTSQWTLDHLLRPSMPYFRPQERQRRPCRRGLESDVSYNLNSLKGFIEGLIEGSIICGIKVDTRSLDYSSCGAFFVCSHSFQTALGLLATEVAPGTGPFAPIGLPSWSGSARIDLE